MKIDLQMHTTYSDGSNSPQEIAKLAHDTNMTAISVTDHDNMSCFPEVKKACGEYGITVITGVEISTKYKDESIHILGYNIDPDDEELKTFLHHIVESKKETILAQFHLLNQKLKDAGRQEADPAKYSQKDTKYFNMPGIALFLFEEGITENKEDGFQYIGGIIKTTPETPVQDAITAIHKAGGKAILSHPLAPKISLKNISSDEKQREDTLSLFISRGLDGLESYGTGHNKDDIDRCLHMAKKYNLITTAGSDRHGDLSEDTGMREYLPYYLKNFGDLKVPQEAIEKIIKDLDIKT